MVNNCSHILINFMTGQYIPVMQKSTIDTALMFTTYHCSVISWKAEILCWFGRMLYRLYSSPDCWNSKIATSYHSRGFLDKIEADWTHVKVNILIFGLYVVFLLLYTSLHNCCINFNFCYFDGIYLMILWN